MCKVKSGVLITNKEDVQNMIIGIIFRQQKKYRLIVDENLDILSRNGAICCKNGNYIPEKFI